VRFYLSEEPILNNVPTYQCRKKEDLEYTLAHLPELVVKEVHGAGGYGMLVGPASTTQEIEDFRQRLLTKPDGYIAQPTLALSACPTYVESGIAPRHIDLRPFVLSGKTISMVRGGLTRVALKEGSLGLRHGGDEAVEHRHADHFPDLLDAGIDDCHDVACQHPVRKRALAHAGCNDVGHHHLQRRRHFRFRPRGVVRAGTDPASCGFQPLGDDDPGIGRVFRRLAAGGNAALARLCGNGAYSHGNEHRAVETPASRP
jgi:hypothetical protein